MIKSLRSSSIKLVHGDPEKYLEIVNNDIEKVQSKLGHGLFKKRTKTNLICCFFEKSVALLDLGRTDESEDALKLMGENMDTDLEKPINKTLMFGFLDSNIYVYMRKNDFEKVSYYVKKLEDFYKSGQCLKSHKNMIEYDIESCKAAIEYETGDIHKGKEMFEKILLKYPLLNPKELVYYYLSKYYKDYDNKEKAIEEIKKMLPLCKIKFYIRKMNGFLKELESKNDNN